MSPARPTPDPPAADPGPLAPWLAEATVAVVGMGLMGASLAGALRGAGGPRRCRRVIGIVRRAEQRPTAAPWADQVSADLAAVQEADVVVLATPARTICRLLPDVAAHLRPGALLLDLGSTKGAIVDVMSTLEAGLLVVGGHPMCGKETGGPANADPALYQGAPFVLCPVPGRPPLAVERATALVRALGAHPRILDTATHDRLVAAISHVPYAAAVALVLAAEAPAAGAGGILWELAAGGFRDTTRVAAGELEMWVDILLTNRPAVLAHLDHLDAELAALRALVAREDAAGLRALLQRAQRRRRGLFL